MSPDGTCVGHLPKDTFLIPLSLIKEGQLLRPTSTMTFFPLLLCLGAGLVSSLKQEHASPDGNHRFIINGVRSVDHAHPWFTNIGLNNGSYVCGGTIIGDRWILTAAHCTVPEIGPERVVVAHTSVFEYGPFMRHYDIKSIINHRDYQRVDKNTTAPSDISIIETTEKIEFTDHVQPISLAKEDLEVGSEVVAIGYGRTETNAHPDFLLEAHDQIRECSADKDASIVCFGSPKANACKGDSGGPLLREDEHGETWQYGIVSAGHTKEIEDVEFCDPMFPSRFTRVSYFCDWIEENTDGEVKCGEKYVEPEKSNEEDTVDPEKPDEEDIVPPNDENSRECIAEYLGRCFAWRNKMKSITISG
ncbi:hypothetical protein QR680_006330 [Steinernema hermaphroditum]|uniref:Peptidase S1 domain-containing protein n=1 Tax=Steinernema hermaphroditum TaxID=289476 RepID=A0AA39HXF2_9BILA|nr:hypothetical protein QR680_006330 [Steinernema hermaphroditum]